MNFDSFDDLVGAYHYDEITMIGKDAVCMGKQIHFAAMVRNKDQAEICMLMLKDPQPLPDLQKSSDNERNRELMKDYIKYGISPKQLQSDDTCLVFESISAGELHMDDLGDMMLLMQLTAAGWRLPQDHPYRKEAWENIELYHCRFSCPSRQLPQLKYDNMKITWSSNIIRYFMEKAFRIPITHSQKHAQSKQEQQQQVQIPFTIQDQNEITQNGICYIHKVTLMDPNKDQEETFANPQYQKKMLEHMTPEEFEATKRELKDMMNEMCPCGMRYPVVEYECTLDLQLKFHTKDYLDALPVCSGKAVTMMWKTNGDKQTGPHGLPLKTDLIQEPVAEDLAQLEAELFEAYKNIPETEEKLKWVSTMVTMSSF